MNRWRSPLRAGLVRCLPSGQRLVVCLAVWFAGSVAWARPNVLFLVVDDLRPALGVYGDPLARTPHLDALASRGMVFERAYCQQALCAPSRASVLTGRRPEAFAKISAGVQAAHYREVLPDVVTLPQLFSNSGYHTESIGKVNHVYPPILDAISWSVPERLADIVKRDEYLSPANRVGGFIDPMVKGEATESIDAPDSAYVDGQAADAAIEALRRLKDQPFFLAVGTKRPHLPWTAPSRYWQMHRRADFELPPEVARPIDRKELDEHPWRYEWRPKTGELRGYIDIPSVETVSAAKAAELRHGYYASVSYVDAQIGRIIDELDRLGLAETTIIVLWSDHGFHLGENGQWGKKSNTELDLRVPLLVVMPGVTKAGSRTGAMVELVDLLPTLADLAGLPSHPDLEGVSFTPVLRDPKRPWKPSVFSHYVRGAVTGRALRSEAHRYIEWSNTASGEVVDRELYFLSADPLQRRNLADREPDLVKEYALQLRAGWRGAKPR